MTTLGLHLGETIAAVWLDDNGTWSSRIVETEHAADELQDWIAAAGSRIAATFDADLRARIIEFPFTQESKIRQVLPIQIEEHLPGASELFEQDLHVGQEDDQGYALITFIKTELLHSYREQLLALTPNAKTLAPAALTMSQSVERPADVAYVWMSEKYTTVVAPGPSGNSFTFSIPIGADRINDEAAGNNLLVRFQGNLKNPIASWIIDGDDNAAKILGSILDKSNAQVVVATAQNSTTHDSSPQVRAALAAAQQLSQRQKPLWNLAPRRPLISPELMQSGILQSIAAPVCMLLLLISITAYADIRSRMTQAESYRSEVQNIFKRNFPKSRMVDPLRQMRSIVDRGSGKVERNDVGKIIDGLAAFHQAITPETQLTISELRSSGGSWILRGEAVDFSGVDQLKKSIESVADFTKVRVQRAEQTVDKSAIRFSVSWSEKS